MMAQDAKHKVTQQSYKTHKYVMAGVAGWYTRMEINKNKRKIIMISGFF